MRRKLFTVAILAILFLLIYWGIKTNAPVSKVGGSKPSSVMVENSGDFRNGDIIFQTSTSGQSEAIQLATKSKYSHMGILYWQNAGWLVFEAVQPIKTTPLDEWINREKMAITW